MTTRYESKISTVFRASGRVRFTNRRGIDHLVIPSSPSQSSSRWIAQLPSWREDIIFYSMEALVARIGCGHSHNGQELPGVPTQRPFSITQLESMARKLCSVVQCPRSHLWSALEPVSGFGADRLPFWMASVLFRSTPTASFVIQVLRKFSVAQGPQKFKLLMTGCSFVQLIWSVSSIALNVNACVQSPRQPFSNGTAANLKWSVRRAAGRLGDLHRRFYPLIT